MVVLIPESISLEARRIAEVCSSLGIELRTVRKSDRVPSGFDLCILADTASIDQIKMLRAVVDECKHIVVVDHHEERGIPSEKTLELVDPGASSTSELVFELARELSIELPCELLEALLAGMVFDTRRFLRASPRTFRNAAEILERGAMYQRALSLTAVPKPQHQRIAKIKCILRHRGFRASIGSEQLFIALSEVGAYESECANTLLGIGYDIAFVFSEDDVLRAIRVVYRAREDVLLRLGLEIYGSILSKLVERFGGGGGGHRAAGAAILRTRDSDEVGRALIKVLATFFKDGFAELAESRVAS